MSKEYIQIAFDFSNQDQFDMLVAELSELGFEGFNEGDTVKVKLIGLDPKTGKFKLSHKVLLPRPEQAPREDRGPQQ